MGNKKAMAVGILVEAASCCQVPLTTIILLILA